MKPETVDGQIPYCHPQMHRWRAEVYPAIDPEGNDVDLVLMVCEICGKVDGRKRPSSQTIPVAGEEEDREVTQVVPGPKPPRIGDSEPPPRQLRERRESNAGFYIQRRVPKR